MRGFLRVEGQGASRWRVAELAAAGADVAAYHEGGRAPSPAFAHVGASAAAADGVQAMRLDDTFRFGVAFVGADAYLEPFRLAYSFHFQFSINH